jgi:protein gp37
MARRLQAMGQPNYKEGFKVAIHENTLDKPLRMKKPQMIFVNSMSDLFHKNVPTKFILKVFDIMNRAHWHTFQILTKRSDRLSKLNSKIEWSPNIWMGVSVETERFVYRIDHLRNIDASINFLSVEPLLSPIKNLNLRGIDWVIVGGESGPHARPMKAEWVLDIRDQCLDVDVPFFFKQWGGVFKKRNGRILEGRTWDQLPFTAPV